MAAPLTLWIGTRKGAFVFRAKDRKNWKIGSVRKKLYGSHNAGENWSVLADSLAPVYSVTAG